MKLNRIIKFFISLTLVLILLFSVSMPVFAFTSPERTGNAVTDFFNGFIFTLGFLVAILVLVPILSIPSLLEALFSGSANFVDLLNEYIQDILSMLGL